MRRADGRCGCTTYLQGSQERHRSRSIDVPRACVAILLCCGAAFGQSHNPDLSTVIAQVGKEIQPDQAMNFLREVYASDRYFTFPRFHQAAEYLRSTMQGIGLRNVEIVEAPADGVTQVGYWTMPLAWDVKSARLEIVDDTLPAQSRVLADYESVPSSLGMWSGPTPKEGITAEVVAVKRGAVSHMDLRGKLALTDENPANIK